MYGSNVNQKILNCFTTGFKKPNWGAEQKIARNRINKKGKNNFKKCFKLQLNKYETVPYYFY